MLMALPSTLAHGALLTAHRDRARADKQQLHEVATVQRQFLYLLLTSQGWESAEVSVSSVTALALEPRQFRKPHRASSRH